MQLVSRDILFKVAAQQKDIHLSEAETAAFKSFIQTANRQYTDAKNSYDLAHHNYMDVFYNEMLEFMRQHKNIVKYVGEGSSRIVFVMADGTALKLAKTEAGIAQNRQESKVCMDPQYRYDIFPEFYGADTKNWLALNCELCAKATANDFKELLRCQPSAIMNVIEFIVKMKIDQQELNKVKTHFEQLDNLVYANFVKLLNDNETPATNAMLSLIDFYKRHGLDEMLIGDLEEIDNWGITIREGQKVLVIIDAGFSEDVYQKFYKRRRKSYEFV